MFGQKREKIQLTIEGMSCDHCRQTVQKGLQELPGVTSVQVFLAEKRADIEFNPKKVSQEQLKEKVRSLGYQT